MMRNLVLFFLAMAVVTGCFAPVLPTHIAVFVSAAGASAAGLAALFHQMDPGGPMPQVQPFPPITTQGPSPNAARPAAPAPPAPAAPSVIVSPGAGS